MAAGQVDVTRREDIYESTRKRFCSKYGHRDLGLGRDDFCKVDGRNGWEGGEESKTIVGGKRGKSRFGDEISRFEDEESMPRQKRIKYSPGVSVDKEIRVLSKNRFFKKSTPGFPLRSSPNSEEKINSLIVDDVSNNSHSTIQLQGKIEDNECTRIRPISMSRWASEEDSPLQKGSSHDRSISSRERAAVDTPESGEILGESCESSKFSDDRSGSEQLNDEVDSVGLFESCLDSEVENDKAAPELRRVNMLQVCRSVRVYEKLGRISEGTYGVVYKARDKETGEIVALKKVKMGGEREGFPLTALREINLLLALHHPSVIDVKEVVMDGNDDVYMVMEYMKYDLRKLIEVMKQPFSEKEVKCLMLQLLEGTKELHDNWILHRDLKTSNILISESGKLKICDFGMSRQYGSPLKPFTTLVVTLWYRAPELLLGAKQYSTAVDMWSVGCIMAELLAKKPLFDGDNEVRQLDKIFRTLGTPTERTWPGLADLPGAKACFAKHPRNTLRDKFPALSFNASPVLSEQGFNLLSQLLTYNPEKRITVDAALAHDWFAWESKHELRAAQESLAQKIKTLT